MADNNTKIILTAEDRTAAALAAVKGNLGGVAQSAELANRALAGIGVTFSGAAMVAMIKGTIDAADGFNDLAQRVGIGIKELAGWTLAANQSGTSMESVAKGVKSLSTYMVEHSDKLRTAGITATDANGAMIQLADLFKAMPDGVQKTALAVQLFGKAGMDMIPMLNQGSKGLADAQEKAEAYGKKMAELAPQADEFNDLVAELGLHSKAAGINITEFMLPGLIGMAKWLNDVATGGEAAQRAVAWMIGDRGMQAMALAGHPGLTGGAPREVSGKIGGQRPAGMTPAEEEVLAEKNAASMRAAGLLDKSTAGSAAAAKYKRGFDPEGDLAYAMDEAQRKAARAQMEANDKEYEALEKKRLAMEAMADRRMEETRIATEGEEAIRESMEKTNDALARQKDMAQELGFTFSSAFEDAIIGGRGLSQVLGGLAQDVARVVLRKSLTEPMGNALSGMIKESGITSFFSDMFNFGGARAGGGPVDSGSTYLVGENGPEMFTPSTSGSIIPNGALGGGITVNIIEDSSRAGQVASRNSGGAQMLDVFVERVRSAIAGDIASGSGPVPAALGNTYGLNRAAGAY